MSSTGKLAGATVVVLSILVGTAFALSNISLTLGSLPSYDFGTVNLTTGDIDQVGTKPATVQFHTFTVKPGEAIGWHYHKALAYVAIEHGTLSEQHVNASDGTCSAWVAFGVGSAFVEKPGEVHRVTNTGKGEAVVTWATAFPTEDGIVPVLPQFSVGGVYPPPNPPRCN